MATASEHNGRTRVPVRCGDIQRPRERELRGHDTGGLAPMSTDPTAPLTSECVLWTGHVRSDGYGQAKRGKGGLAHRYLWVQAHGPIPVGKEIHHICGNRTCVNLDHLEPLTRREHMLKDGRTERAAALGRLNPPRRWDHVTPGEPVTHCIRGHAYDEVNTYVYKGARFCRACHRASALRGYHAARQ